MSNKTVTDLFLKLSDSKLHLGLSEVESENPADFFFFKKFVPGSLSPVVLRKKWKVGTEVSAGDIIYLSGRLFKVLKGGVSYNEPSQPASAHIPFTTEDGIEWEFLYRLNANSQMTLVSGEYVGIPHYELSNDLQGVGVILSMDLRGLESAFIDSGRKIKTVAVFKDSDIEGYRSKGEATKGEVVWSNTLEEAITINSESRFYVRAVLTV